MKTTPSDESSERSVPRKERQSFSPASYCEFEYSASYPGQVITHTYIGSFVKNTFSFSQPGPRKDI